MDELIVRIATWMLLIESFLVVCFVIVNYMIRFYHYLLLRDNLSVNDKIKAVFFSYVKDQSEVNEKDMKFFQKHILNVLKMMETYEVASELKHNWESFQNQLVIKLFYPRAKSLYNSWRAYKRYYAARCFYAHFKESDADMVIKLIKDPILLVSLNASRVAFKYHSPVLINESIDVFSKKRKIRQSIYATIAHQHSEAVERIVIDRLFKEQDPYVKAFCYRLLQQLPITESIDALLNTDLNSSVTDLQVSALHYCGYNPQYHHYLGRFIDDEKWQLRAAAAELIGKVRLTSAIPALAQRLSDHEWWVRIRTAEALGRLGEEGVQVLKRQTPERDRYAYDAAQQVLDALLWEGAP